MHLDAEFKNVIGLGSREATATVRLLFDAQGHSIFDDIVGSASAIADAIIDDFAQFLQPTDLRLLPGEDGETVTTLLDTSYGLRLTDDSGEAAKSVSAHDELRRRYKRAVLDFRRAANDGPTLFVMQDVSAADADQVVAAIATRFPMLEFRLLLVGSTATETSTAATNERLLQAALDVGLDRADAWKRLLEQVLAKSINAGLLTPAKPTFLPSSAPATKTWPIQQTGPHVSERAAKGPSPSWIIRRREALVDALKQVAAKDHLIVTQPFFPFYGTVEGADVIWADDQHIRKNLDFTCDIFFNQGYSPDFERIRYVRETGRATLVATWFWDNHHMFASTMRAAMLSDVHFHAHHYMSSYISNELSVSGGFAPLCPIFWTKAVVEEACTRSLLATRSNQLYGGYNSYAEFPDRDVVLRNLIEYIPDNNIFITPHGVPPDQHRFYGMTPLQRLEEWMHYKVSLCISFAANMAIRIFDMLLGGGIPLLVGRPADLDMVFSREDQEALPIIVVDDADPAAVLAAYSACIELFDAGGADGILRRAAFARDHHMPENRMRTLISSIRSIAADADNIDRYVVR